MNVCRKGKLQAYPPENPMVYGVVLHGQVFHYALAVCSVQLMVLAGRLLAI